MRSIAAYAAPALPAAVVVGFFVWFANWIPQTRWQAPQKLAISEAMTPAELGALGATLVRQRGCLTCHTIEPGAGVKGGGRGPNLADVASRRARGAEGAPGNLVEYLVQSLYEPGAYLVEGFANIMPPSTAAPAKLGYEEVVAVVNYLQSLGGRSSVKIGDIARPSGAAAAPAPVTAAASDPKALFDSLGCAGCHSLEAGKNVLGPSLDAAALAKAAAARKMSLEALVLEAIVDPKAYEAKEFPAGVMPQDYGAKLTGAQLRSLVEYLAGRKS
ncbi:MAG: c-type cytochrome [Ideonella sp.]|nr:c-type cytochrome [Ideonella sp.]MCC7459559.1 c-type cytochrome [Nitrospira sp.]